MIYDYIIVGAGSTGAALAARLSEDPDVRVLLLEAGPDLRAADMPAAMRSLNPNRVQWDERFAAHRWPELLARRTDAQPARSYIRGRGVGGSSVVNGQVALRGAPEDFDGWAAQGCAGWSWDDVLPSLVRLEDDLDYGDAPWHGRGGPNPVYRLPADRWGAVDLALREAALDHGYGWSDDSNAPDSRGVSPYAINGRDGLRVTVSDAYLEPTRGRANLEIIADALVDRALIEDRRAVGVRVRIDGAWVERRANEVILSAGAIHSPTILQRSGIGPVSWLEPLGIAVVRDAPVGRNLIDHPFVGVELDLKPAARASANDRHTNCCVRYSSGVAGCGSNDMILMAINISGLGERGLATGSIGASVFQSFSHGSVRITSPDPNADPEIDLQLLSDQRDLIRLRDGARRIVEFARHPAVTHIAHAVRPWLTTGIGLDDLASDAALDEWLLSTVNDCYHPSGACRMGASDDARAVVDADCRVIGVEGLRVIDASIMPEIVRANLQLTCVMIGEHMAARMASDGA